MNAAPLARVVVVLALAAPPLARGELVEARARTALRERPSSAAKTIHHLPAATRMTVVDRTADGRWLQVLSGERQGWLRAVDVEVVEEPPPEAVPASPSGATEPAPATGGPGVRPDVWVSDSRYHAGGQPPPGPWPGAQHGGQAATGPGQEGEVGALVVTRPSVDLLDRPHEGAAVVATVVRGRRLSTVRASHDGGFYLVELDGAGQAWAPASGVEAVPASAPADAVGPAPANTPAGAAGPAPANAPDPAARAPANAPDAAARAPANAPASEIEPPGSARGPSAVSAHASPAAAADTIEPRRDDGATRRLRVRIGGGFALGHLSQTLRSNGRGALSNYAANTGLVGLEAGLGLDLPIAGGFFGGLGASYRFGGAAEITADLGGEPVKLGVRVHDLELDGALGYRAAALGGLRAWLGAGARLLFDLIDRDPVVAVPSERVVALTIGAGLALPRLVDRFGLQLFVGWIPVGRRELTPGLGEGDEVSTIGYTLHGSLSCDLGRGLDLVLAGGYASLTTRFAGAAERDPSISAAGRTTALASLSLGLRYAR